MTYDFVYFINKFLAIPEQLWTCGKTSDEHGRHCALGFCGVSNTYELTDEAVALSNLLKKHPFFTGEQSASSYVFSINDLCFSGLGDTPKQRILAALYCVKGLQQPQYKDITKELAILSQDETADIKQQKLSLS